MKLRIAFLAALTGACPALAASPAGDIAGTWECRQPGIQYRNKPPILFVADSGGGQVTLEVDGFSREIFGRSDVSAGDQAGWWRVKPAQGQEFMIRPEGISSKQKTASMQLSFADGKPDYHCLRLPLTATPTPVGAPAAGDAPPPPADAGATPPPADSGAAPAPQGMQPEGAAKPNQ